MSVLHQVREGLWGGQSDLYAHTSSGDWYVSSDERVLGTAWHGLCPVDATLSASGLSESGRSPGTFLLPLAFFVTT